MHDHSQPNRPDLGGAWPLTTAYDEKRIHVRHSKKVRPAKSSQEELVSQEFAQRSARRQKSSTSRRSPGKASPKTSKGSQRATIASSSPLGMMALHLLAQWKESGRERSRVPRREREQGGAARQRHSRARSVLRSAGVSAAEYPAVRSAGTIARDRRPSRLGAAAPRKIQAADLSRLDGGSRDGALAVAGEPVAPEHRFDRPGFRKRHQRGRDRTGRMQNRSSAWVSSKPCTLELVQLSSDASAYTVLRRRPITVDCGCPATGDSAVGAT